MEVVQNKITHVFNKFYYDFVADVSSTCASLKPLFKLKVKDLSTSRYLKLFVDGLDQNVIKDICSTSHESLFTLESIKPLQIHKNVTMENVLSELQKDYHDVLASYFYIFVVLKLVYDVTLEEPTRSSEEDEASDSEDIMDMDNISTCSVLFDKTLECIRLIQKKEDFNVVGKDIFDENIKKVLECLNQVNKTDIKDDDEDDETSMPNDIGADILQGTKIGNLAQEISKEIDLKELNIEKPEDILNLGNNNMLGNIINKVGSKMQEKIDNGELKHEDLIKEAFGMFNSMGKSSPMFNNPMVQNLFKNMGAGNARVNTSKLKEMSTRERLRKKHEDRQKTKST